MQQAITWANVHPDLCRQMASLDLNELVKIVQLPVLKKNSIEIGGWYMM